MRLQGVVDMSRICPKCALQMDDDDMVCPNCRTIIMPDVPALDVDLDTDDIFSPGMVIADDYQIVRFIGKGGAGRVYEAKQISLRNMPVALKVLHKDLNENESALELMKKEVIISRELTHENVIKIYSLAKVLGRYYVVMEFVAGRSLQSLLSQCGTCSIEVIGAVLAQVCDALQYAHSRGVIHLDIKPANLLIGASGNVKVCDFGIARMAFGKTSTVTQRLIVGSIGFMPPEQFTGRRAVTPKSDIYSLGATVYYCLTGELPVGASAEIRPDVPACTRLFRPTLPSDSN